MTTKIAYTSYIFYNIIWKERFLTKAVASYVPKQKFSPPASWEVMPMRRVLSRRNKDVRACIESSESYRELIEPFLQSHRTGQED